MRSPRMCARRVSPSDVTSCATSRYAPELGRSRQPRIPRSVVFPEPDGPMIATYSPSWTVKLTSCSAFTATSPVLCSFEMWSISMTAGRPFSGTFGPREDDLLAGADAADDLDALVVLDPELDLLDLRLSGRRHDGHRRVLALCSRDRLDRHRHDVLRLLEDDAHAHVHPGAEALHALDVDADREGDDAGVVDACERREGHLAGHLLPAERVDADDGVEPAMYLGGVELAERDVRGEVVEVGDVCDRRRRIDRSAGDAEEPGHGPARRRPNGQEAVREARGREPRGRGSDLQARHRDVDRRRGCVSGPQRGEIAL